MPLPARAERNALCDLFVEVGPDAPTLCGDWTTRDLAAHLVVRERRPDAAIGIVSRLVAAHGDRVRLQEAERPWPDLIERVRTGPPTWSPMHFEPIDAFANTVELFVHHEDVRRAASGWTTRTLDAELEDALAGAIGRMGAVLTRKAGVGIVVQPDGRPAARARRGEPAATVSGPIGECVLYLFGRKGVAQVTLGGPDDAVARVAAAPFGL